MNQQGPHFSPQCKAKANYKNTNLRKITSGICDVVIVSLHSKKTRLKKLIMIITRNVLLSAQMGERASVVLICIITSRYNEVK